MSIAAQIRQESETRESARRQRGAELYRALVKATAAGGKPPAFEKIEQTAAAAGRSVENFVGDVEKQEKRIAIAARLKQIPAQREKLAELRQEIEAHEAVLEKALEQHRRVCEPVVDQMNQLEGEIDQADQLKRELVSGADPETIAAIDAAAAEHQEADASVRQAQQAVEIGNGSEERLKKFAGSPGFDTQHHEQIVAAAKAAEAALPGLQRALADAESRYAQARQRQLEP